MEQELDFMDANKDSPSTWISGIALFFYTHNGDAVAQEARQD